MAPSDPETLRELMRLLKSDDLKDRLPAIMALGDIGDEAALCVALVHSNYHNDQRGGRDVPVVC